MQDKFGTNENIEALAEDLKLFNNEKWTVWENIDYIDKNENKTDWGNKMRRVAWFDNIINFHMAWNKIPHADVSKVLYDAPNNQFNM